MSKRYKRKKAGLPPGSIVFTGDQKVDKVFIHYLQYDAGQFHEETYDNHQQIELHDPSEEKVDWYDIRGLHDIALLATLGEKFEIHNLVLEDIADIRQRPKFEEYAKGIFITLRAISFNKETLNVTTEQVAIFFRKELLISFQERETDLLINIRNRLKNSRGKIRNRNADYLAYALIDVVVDNYFFVLDEIENEIEILEENIISGAENTIKQKIHHLKKELLTIRKSISPLREAISRFAKSDNEFIEENSTFYIRDLHDHTIQIMDMAETYRDLLNGLQDLYLSEISFRMNQVMQILAVVTTIFVPLSFLAGLYGMNFVNIPELQFQNGYFILLGVMIFIAISLLWYFKKRNWF